jgi:hypothetical protein
MDRETSPVDDESGKMFFFAIFVFTMIAIFVHLYTIDPHPQIPQTLADDREWPQDRPDLSNYSSSDDDDD